ncbi:MAG: hypothetical protein JXC31_00790 [Acholeplasmataceae bacterium]|nr:hypothetical protein [Acholeplasmataceae bacterium]
MKKTKDIDSRFISIILGVLATMMILFQVLVLKDSDTSFTGLEVAFGHEFANLGQLASGEIKFNPMVLLAFIFPLAGSLVLMFTKKGYLVSTILFVVATIFILMIPQFTTVTVTLFGNPSVIDVEWVRGLGLIFAAILSFVGAMIGLFKLYKNS